MADASHLQNHLLTSFILRLLTHSYHISTTEGDYWNSKYWLRRTSSHPFLDFYSEAKGDKGQGATRAMSFVDQVEAVAKGKKAGSASTACGARNLVEGVKGLQARELVALVEGFWRQEQSEHT